MLKPWCSGLLWILISAAVLQGQSRESILKSVQDTSKWSPADKPVSYDSKNIEALAGTRSTAINSYGLSAATVQNWSGSNGNVRLTLFEMLDASAAYGLFTLERNIDQSGFTRVPFGTEGFRVGNRTEFWQSKYVVRLDGTPAAADELARTISENILGSSRKPPVSTHLPPANLIQGSDKYVLEAASVDRKLNLDAQALGFDNSVEIATADYRVGGNVAHLVLLMYPTQQLAKKYEEAWAAAAPDDGAFRKRVGALLALVRGARNPDTAKAILDGVNYETQVTWDQPRPDLSLREVILTIFSFIGIALLFTVVVGLSFGGVRIFVKARYPNRVFDRAQDMEIIQLKLAQGLTQRQLHD